MPQLRRGMLGGVLAGALLLVGAGCGSQPASSARQEDPTPSNVSSGPPVGSEETGTLRSGGQDRSYLLYVPTSALGSAVPIPIVVAFHGPGGTGAQMRTMTKLNEMADRNRFVVAYPNAVAKNWADGRGVTPADQANVDDVGFVNALLDLLQRRFTVDPARVYAAGFSNGALFAMRVACEMADRFTAVAAVSGTLSQATADDCEPARELSILIINGDQDPYVPFGGGAGQGEVGSGELLGARATADRWVQRDGCRPQPDSMDLPDTRNDGTHHSVLTWPACGRKTEVSLHVVKGGGHGWPGSQVRPGQDARGRLSQQFDASEVVWDFFFAHPAPK